MKKVLFFILCASLLLSACEPTAEPRIIIIPKQCKLSPGEQLPLSLESSNKPQDSVITWLASDGTLSSNNDLSVVYTAPDKPGTVIITAKLNAGKQEFTTTLTCDVTSGFQIVTDVPTSTTLPEPPTQEPTSTSSTPTADPRPVGNTIAITEVMPYPCGFTDSLPSVNEYLELYNYGAADVNVGGWWIGTTGGGLGTPDQLVPWKTVNPTVDLGTNVELNDTVIAPGEFAIVISPNYHTGAGQYRTPYSFRSGTTILTFATSDFIGNDSKGLAASYHPITTIVLYKGTNRVMSSVISTYGTPSYGSDPGNITDDRLDHLPYFISQCHAMERIDAAKPDALSNWHEINTGTPGWGGY